MNALKLRELLLLLLLLFARLSAAGKSAAAQEQAECSGQEASETLYVGVYIVTDSSFQSCSPYKGQTLKDYLRAFVGGVGLHFQELKSPSIRIVYLGSRDLTDDEEREIIGSIKGTTDIAVKGADALKHIMGILIENNEKEDFPGNTLFLVLTGLNVTEEETENTVNTFEPVSDSSDSNDDAEYDDVDSREYRTVNERADPRKKPYGNVGGLSQYGSICFMAGAIVQDYGRNFSGVAAAAQQAANVLGPIYNGTISRRHCSEDDFAESSFHGKECSAVNTLSHEKDKFDCLKEQINGTKGEVMTPCKFYETHFPWTPCGTSYPGSEECQKPEGTIYQHKDCSILCCLKSNLRSIVPSDNPIPAPDGEQCDAGKICVGGKCVKNTTSTEGK